MRLFTHSRRFGAYTLQAAIAEQIGGLWVLEAADLDEAVAWGSKAAVARRRPLEVRPFLEDPSK